MDDGNVVRLSVALVEQSPFQKEIGTVIKLAYCLYGRSHGWTEHSRNFSMMYDTGKFIEDLRISRKRDSSSPDMSDFQPYQSHFGCHAMQASRHPTTLTHLSSSAVVNQAMSTMILPFLYEVTTKFGTSSITLPTC